VTVGHTCARQAPSMGVPEAIEAERAETIEAERAEAIELTDL
jgi:hypothetical protein